MSKVVQYLHFSRALSHLSQVLSQRQIIIKRSEAVRQRQQAEMPMYSVFLPQDPRYRND